MKLPNLTFGPICDNNFNVSTEWAQYFSQTTQQIQENFSDNGVVLPKQTSANISLLSGSSNIGLMVYDSDTNEFKININGTWKVVQTI